MNLALLVTLCGSSPAFQNTSVIQPQPADSTGATSSIYWGDLDGDGRPEALALQADGAPRLLRADPGGGFVDITANAGLGDVASARLALWEDVDGDGDQDLLLTTPSAGSALFLNDGGRLEQLGAETGLDLRDGVLHARFIDFDADGLQDLYLATMGADRLYRNLGSARFEPVEAALPDRAARPMAGRAGTLARPDLVPVGEDSEGGESALAGGVTTSGRPVGGVSRPASLGGCAVSVQDASSGACMQASSIPTLGSLYPLGADFNIDGAGRVGIGTLTPAFQMDVAGDVHASGQLISSVTAGAPLAVASSVLVADLNADQLDGFDASAFSQLGPSIGLAELELSSVDGSKIVNGSIFAANLADGSVTGAKIVNGTVTSIDMAPNSVYSLTIADGQSVNADVSGSAAIQGSKIDADFGSQVVTTTGDLGVGTTNPLRDIHVVGGAVGQVLVAPNAAGSGGSSELLLAEDDDGTYGIQLAYNGADDQFELRQKFASSETTLVGIDYYTAQMSIGNAGAHVGQLTVNGSADSGSPTIYCDAGAGDGIVVYGESTATNLYGVDATVSGPSSIALFGRASNPAGGGCTAVRGVASHELGKGVAGAAFTSTGVNYGVLGTTNSSSGYGVFSDGDMATTGSKAFIQPHPTDPSKEIRFFCLEGNESGTYFRGTSRLSGGLAIIDVPEEFRLVSELSDLTVQVTARGAAMVWVESSDLDSVVIRGSSDIEFDYQVNGIRRGWQDVELMRENTSFVPTERGVEYGTQFPEDYRRIMVESGVLNADFTPNEGTAQLHGWTLTDPVATDRGTGGVTESE